MSVPVGELREDLSAIVATVGEEALVHVDVIPHIVQLSVGDCAKFAYELLIPPVCLLVQLRCLVKARIIVVKRLIELIIGATIACHHRVYLFTEVIIIMFRYSCAYVWLLVLDLVHDGIHELLHHQVILVGRIAQEHLEGGLILLGERLRSESFDFEAFNIQVSCQNRRLYG